MSADELAAVVAELGALPVPVPVGPEPRTLDVVEHELTGARLSLYEEELETARLRLALASAKRGRRVLRARIAELLAERHVTNEALDDAVQALRARRVLSLAEYGRVWGLIPDRTDRERVDAVLASVGLLAPPPPCEPGTCVAWYWDGSGWWQCVEGAGHDHTEGHHNGEGLTWADGVVHAEPVPDAVTRVFVPVASLREPDGEFHSFLHHAHTTPHDLPETGTPLVSLPAPQFFRPGRLYAAGERFRFRCDSVVTDPETGKPRAVGQHGRLRTADGEWLWAENGRTYDDWRGGCWVDITDEGGA